MLIWITQNIGTILPIIVSLIGALITWAVRTHFKLKNSVKDHSILKKEVKDSNIEIHKYIDMKISDTGEKMDTLINGLREDLKCVKRDNEVISNQIREDIKGIQINIRDLTLSVTRLVGYLEGKKVLSVDVKVD